MMNDFEPIGMSPMAQALQRKRAAMYPFAFHDPGHTHSQGDVVTLTKAGSGLVVQGVVKYVGLDEVIVGFEDEAFADMLVANAVRRERE